MTRFCAPHLALAVIVVVFPVCVIAGVIEEESAVTPEVILSTLGFDDTAFVRREEALAEALSLL